MDSAGAHTIPRVIILLTALLQAFKLWTWFNAKVAWLSMKATMGLAYAMLGYLLQPALIAVYLTTRLLPWRGGVTLATGTPPADAGFNDINDMGNYTSWTQHGNVDNSWGVDFTKFLDEAVGHNFAGSKKCEMTNDNKECIPESFLILLMGYVAYQVLFSIPMYVTRFSDVSSTFLAPWRHMIWLSGLYGLAHFCGKPGIEFIAKFAGADQGVMDDLNEWNGEGIQMHPDAIMFCGGLLGVVEWSFYLVGHLELTTMDSFLSIIGTTAGVKMLRHADDTNRLPLVTYIKQAFRRPPETLLTFAGWLRQHFDRIRRDYDLRAVIRSYVGWAVFAVVLAMVAKVVLQFDTASH